MKNKKSGFSIIELLVAISILGILAGIAIPAYQKYKEAPIIAAMKFEALELSRYLHYAKAVDGGYHQKIYTMGYRPSENMIASAGFFVGITKEVEEICGRFPVKTGDFSSYFTLTGANMFVSGHLESSTRGYWICENSDVCSFTKYAYQASGERKANFTSGDEYCKNTFHGKKYVPSCDEFYLYSRASLKKDDDGYNIPYAQIALNHEGLMCYSKPHGDDNDKTSTKLEKI